MIVESIKIDVSKVKNWDDFHDVMQEAFGFPEFYGRNMNAWIDCLTSIDQPEDGLTKKHVAKGNTLVLEIEGMANLREVDNDMYQAIIEDSAFVNYRRTSVGEPAVLTLSFWRNK